jgi:predicted Fe-Mo cluster-binding NifX family protein
LENVMQAIESTQLISSYRASGTHANDPAAKMAANTGGLPLATLERFLDDLKWNQDWRREADLCADYYDGNQLAREVLEALNDKGLGPLVRNLIQPTVNAVLGLEERNRQDWRVVTDLDDQQEVAEGLSQKLAQAERESQADRAISDAYAGAIKTGFAAVEVSRAANPFCYEYRVEAVHRREMFWDPRSRKPDWSDARFVMRRRWYDSDVVAAHFPAHAKLIQWAAHGWQEGWEQVTTVLDGDSSEQLSRALDLERSSRIEEQEWRDTQRGRICVYEVWYRTFHRGHVLKLSNGRAVEYDKNNQQHVALVMAGLVRPREAVFDKFRCAYFVGPHRVADYASTRRKFPYVPFWGYREDLTGAPYGLIRSMMSVQDEVNARLAKMMWLMSSRRTVIEDDAVSGNATEFNDMSDVQREVGRADAFIVLNSNRRNQNAIKVDENLELAEAQHRAMQDAMVAMSQVSGIYTQMMGNPGSLTANSAIQTILEQGMVSLAEINANYIYGRRMVGEQLLELVKEDSMEPHDVTLADGGDPKKTIHFNRRVQDPATGMEMVENSVADTPVKVQLTDVPQTASYRQQQLVSMSEVVKSLPEAAQAILAPYMMELTDIPKRKEIAKLLREQMGIAADPETEEGQAIIAQQQKAAQMQERAAMAEIAEKEAKAQKTQAEAAKITREASDGFMEQQAEREHQAKMAEIAERQQSTSAKAQADIEATRAKAAADVEIARTNSAGEQKIQALAEEFDARMKDLEQTIKEAVGAEREEAEGKPPVIVDVNGNVAKELGAQHKERMAARGRTEAEGRETTKAMTKAIQQLGEMQKQALEGISQQTAQALAQQAQSLQAAMESLVAARPAPEAREARPSVREVEIIDPDTGKTVRARVRTRKGDDGRIVREVEMVDPVTGKSVRTSRSE